MTVSRICFQITKKLYPAFNIISNSVPHITLSSWHWHSEPGRVESTEVSITPVQGVVSLALTMVALVLLM